MTSDHIERRAMRASDCMPVPIEGQRVQVLWARLGNKTEVGEQWCDAEFLGRRGSQYLVRGGTPRSNDPIIRPVSPESVRFEVAS
jgi:hypothetical protein